MNKYTPEVLIQLFDTFEENNWRGEHDISALLNVGYDHEDIRLLYKVYTLLNDDPHISDMALMANGVSWNKQGQLFGGIDALRTALGLDDLIEELPVERTLDDDIAFDCVVLPIWRRVTPLGFVLREISNANYRFINKASGQTIHIKIDL